MCGWRCGVTANAGSDAVVCNDLCDHVALDGTSSYSGNGQISFYTCDITHTENSTYDRTESGPNPTITGLAPGQYNVTLTVTDSNGYSDTDQIVLIVKDFCNGCNVMKGDLDGDGDVDGDDLKIFSRHFGTNLSTQ